MLLEFTVENYLSIKEPVTLSMIASKDEDNACNVINPEEIKKQVDIVVPSNNESGFAYIIDKLLEE